MTGHGFNGRLTRLEAVLAPPERYQCRACGLRHVQPLTMELARRIIGPVSTMATTLQSQVAGEPVPRLCLCDPCCGAPRDRWLARRSHGAGDAAVDALTGWVGRHERQHDHHG
jgi:hypothetical protein